MPWTPANTMLTRLAEEHFNGAAVPDPAKFYLILCNPGVAFTSATDLSTVLQAELTQAFGYVRASFNPGATVYDAGQFRAEVPRIVTTFTASGASLAFTTAYLLSGASATANKTVVSMTASTDQIQITAHGLIVGDKVIFTGAGTIATPLVKGTIYFVQAVVDANNITVSSTSGGALLNLTADSSGALDCRYANGELELFEIYSLVTIVSGSSHNIELAINLAGGDTTSVNAA